METISPVYARLVLRELQRREIDPAPLFDDLSIGPDELLHGGDISMPDFLHMLRAGDQLLDDEQLGFLLGRKIHVLALGPVGVAIASAPNLREGLQVLESFSRLHATYVDIGARSTLQGMTVTILYRHDTGDVERFHTETAMMLLQQYIETTIGEPIRDARFRLAIPKPENRMEYTDALHGQISFGATANEVDIPHRWLNQPSPFYHPELWRQAQMTLSKGLKRLSASEEAPYTQHIAGLLRTSEPPLADLAAVAFDLNISQRTLNRRLQAENTSFRRLKSQAMTRWAKQYLRETDYSVEAIAEALGYKDTANFRRAFRKSEGCSPVEYRQETPG
ncbi:MAG: helix-turn-helix domain-containing protein [Gammaproteobacteria bacterium]|nr:AraC family transcriptional regulator [Gammaproteobacteria bacterium]NNL52032.1 helix-turn-helix domain-containing protein [Woeseiaceae bacterium]NNM19700.1 helix-turn-helix domain-containing protein [Gammaproteobacteria bacterium]